MMDTARQVLVVDLENGVETGRELKPLNAVNPIERAVEIKNLQIEVLLCGAISRLLESSLLASGIGVVPLLCGDVESILHAFTSNNLQDSGFRMPGCPGRRMRGRGRGGGFYRRRGRRGR